MHKYCAALLLLAGAGSTQGQVLNTGPWTYTYQVGQQNIFFQSREEFEFSLRQNNPSYEVAFWIPTSSYIPTAPLVPAEFTQSLLDLRIGGTLLFRATLPPAEFGSTGFAVWNQAPSAPWRVDTVNGCLSETGSGYCPSAQALADQITANYTTATTCVITPATIAGVQSSALGGYLSGTSFADDPLRHWLVGGRINRGNPSVQDYKVSIRVKLAACSNTSVTPITLTWPIAQVQHYVCPENWRVNLNPNHQNIDTYCLASAIGRGTQQANKSSEALRAPVIPPQPADKLFLLVPARDADTCPKVGNPCQLATGKKTETVTDFSYAGINFQRYYDSVRDGADYGNLGPAWSHSFSNRVFTEHQSQGHAGSSSAGLVYYLNERGHVEFFKGASTSGDLYAVSGSGDKFNVTAETVAGNIIFQFTLVKANGERVKFNNDGYPIAYEYPDSPQRNLTLSWASELTIDDTLTLKEYAPRRLIRVINAQGRGLRFEYTTNGRSRLKTISSDTESLVLATYKYEVENVWPQQQFVTHAFGNLKRAEVANLATNYSYKVYEGRNTALLTGIAHEYGGVSRPYGIYAYDDRGRVSLSQHVGGVNTVIPSYQEDSLSASALLPLGATITATIQQTDHRRPLSVVTGTGPAAENTTFEYDAQGRTSFVRRKVNATQWSVTQYVYASAIDIRPFEIIEGKDTPSEKKTQTTWNVALNKPLTRTVFQCDRATPSSACQWRSLSVQQWAYNGDGQVLASCQKDPNDTTAMAYQCSNTGAAPSRVRRTVHSYCTPADVSAALCPIVGQRLSSDGPRTDVNDVTTYSYRQTSLFPSYQKGDLWKVTNAAGHVTEYLSYDQGGRVLTMKDQNGILITMTYHPRGWLASRTIKGSGATSLFDSVTTIGYTAFGAIDRVTQADGAYLQYGYDSAERMTSVSDNFGNTITYTLDVAGNRIKETTTNGVPQIKRLMARQYDQLSRMRSSIRAPFADQANLDDPSVRKTTFVYDASGNQDIVTNPDLGNPATAGTVTDVEYDPLSRLISSTQDPNGTINARVEYSYDALSRVTKVRDPNSLDTVYSYDGLGDQTSLNSPDTGITAFTYDAAGNRKTVLDARGVKSELTYDAMNRLTKIEYIPAGATVINSAKTVQFYYDQSDAITACNGAFSTGRLTGFSDETGSTTLCYDRRGNVIAKRQTANGSTLSLSMGINKADRLTGVVYPSGMAANYLRDAQGRVTSVSINGAAFITSISYLPFGPINQITFANGKILTKNYDQNYDIDAITSTAVGGLNLDYAVDEVGNIVGVNQSGTPFKLNYDKLYRLTSVRDQNDLLVEEFSYDATGNRMTKRLGNGPSLIYSYAPSSHKLTNAGDGVRNLDANGNTLNTPQNATLSYDERNRLVGTSASCPKKPCLQPYNTSAMYNARGERVLRFISSVGPLQTKVMMYDESGKLLVDDAGEIVYLDQIPIARVNSGVIYPIETDHLGSPRVLLDTSGSNAVWTWNLLTNTTTGSNAFGEQAPSSSVLEFNLRFPGQYADGNGLSYNYFRDYEPGTGRYLESDPIGLRGGISTFGYALQSSLSNIDLFGLTVYSCTRDMRAIFPFNNVPHDYTCATSPFPGMPPICGGHGPSPGDYLWGPGKDTGEKYSPNDCKPTKQGPGNCEEVCVIWYILKPRPEYNVGWPGTRNCWDWAEDVVKLCKKRCSDDPNFGSNMWK